MPSILTAEICTNGIWPLAFFFIVALAIFKWVWMKQFPLSVKCLWVYVLLRAFIAFEYPYPFFGAYSLAFKATAGQCFAEVLFIPIGAVLIAPYIERILPWVVSFTIACVWLDFPGLMEAPSFNTALCALALPFLPFWMGFTVVITVLSHHGSTALLIIGAQIVILFVKFECEKAAKFLGAFIVLMILAAVAYRHSGAMFDGGERLQKYAQFMKLWARDWKTILIGASPGSFMWVSIIRDMFKPPLFLQMHSDFLQVIWELGLVGFGLSIWAWCDAIRKAWGRPGTLAALFGFMAFCLPYHPLRFAPTALLSAYIFVLAFGVTGASMSGCDHQAKSL